MCPNVPVNRRDSVTPSIAVVFNQPEIVLFNQLRDCVQSKGTPSVCAITIAVCEG